MARWHRSGDPWGRGSYSIPNRAVMGSSDCGMWSDSPAPTPKVKAELDAFRAVLKSRGIPSRLRYSSSTGSAFMQKRWVVVGPLDFERAKLMATLYLVEHDRDTEYVHDAD